MSLSCFVISIDGLLFFYCGGIVILTRRTYSFSETNFCGVTVGSLLHDFLGVCSALSSNT